MDDFAYHRPATLDEAAMLVRSHDDFKVLAGGMSLLPTLKLRLARPAGLVDLGAIESLRGIRRERDNMVIGAITSHATVAASAEVLETIPALAELAGGIGDPLVRNCGTIGGSIANADPAADYPAAVVGLDAVVWTNQRKIAASEFFCGLFETALRAGEIVTAVSFPIPEFSAYVKLRQPASRFAVVGAFVAKTPAGVRVAITGAGPTVFRLKDAEAALDKRFDASALDSIAVKPDALNSDIHASAEYRAHCVRVMAQRAVLAAR
jgi:aerobic carbon-monoxide dehydrogenase medium subunit